MHQYDYGSKKQALCGDIRSGHGNCNRRGRGGVVYVSSDVCNGINADKVRQLDNDVVSSRTSSCPKRYSASRPKPYSLVSSVTSECKMTNIAVTDAGDSSSHPKSCSLRQHSLPETTTYQTSILNGEIKNKKEAAEVEKFFWDRLRAELWSEPSGPSACVYITYQKPEDALRAVKSLTSTKIDGQTIKVFLGTTKYCSNFVKGVQCPKAECLYLHELADEEASFTKEDIHLGFPVSNSENNRVNHSRNVDEGSKSSDDLRQNNSYDSSDVSELSPSSNHTLHNIRNIGSDINNESESNHQNNHSGNPELRTNSDMPSKSIFRSEENIINNLNFQDTINPSFSNQIQQKKNESLQQPNFLNNQIFESASRGQSSSKESTLLRLLSSAILENGQKKQVQDGVNMKYKQVETRATKRDDDPDLEFDPCQESLKGLQDLLMSEAKERARLQYNNAMNRSPLSHRSPALSIIQPFENCDFRNTSLQAQKARDPPSGFSNNCTQNIHFKPPYESATALLNKSPLPLHNQLGGIRTNCSLQRYPQPGVSMNNSFSPDYTSPHQSREIPEYISPVLKQQHNQRLMNLSQVQYPLTEQRSSSSWNNTSQSQWRPIKNMFFNQAVTENRATNDINLRVPIRSNDTTTRQWQQFLGNVSNLSPFPDHPPTTPEQVANQAYKVVEAVKRNSRSFGHLLQYTKKL